MTYLVKRRHLNLYYKFSGNSNKLKEYSESVSMNDFKIPNAIINSDKDFILVTTAYYSGDHMMAFQDEYNQARML